MAGMILYRGARAIRVPVWRRRAPACSGNDIYLSDPLFDALIADRPHPFRDLHLRFVAAAARATDRYGHPSAASAVDVGAHLGIHAVTLRALGFRVLAAEPHPASHRLLECNGAFRPPLGAGNLTLLRAAVTSHPPPAPGTLHLSTPYPSNIGHSLLVPSPDPTSTPVALTSLDELSRLLPALPWLLKVSAEGHEPAILSRTSVLRSPATRPRYIAVHMDAPSMLRDAGRGGAEPESLFAALFGNGYRLFARLPGGMDRVDKAHAAHGVLKGDREVVLGGADLRGVVREGGWLWAVHGDEIGGSQGEE
ncbi:hypothetical protein DFJ74DRAFT_713269 [Hyaloraphidium curvatum]|nr:hypothetical protein DFJ74DRAFT_713269 [Hyaloraphidium curvatum]